MAALPAGVQYGLSSESSYKENKELVFVKLTDSALKAIEDFIKNNRDKLAKPTIQFLPGNEGKISIPTPANGNSSGEATFHFSINNSAEMEGPQGSFECVRSGGPRRLESCGPLPRRMRVHANDDSYESTKDRMARMVAAEQSKSTRVIKPNQTDIGRRVKVRSQPHAHFTTAANSLADRIERMERLDRAERPDRPERPERPERAERPSAAVLRPQAASAHPAAIAQSHAPQHQRPPPNPDLSRRSIKERLIQLLALKPFKKPELYARLTSEGIKDRDRTVVNKILASIGTLKDNCYHLRRHMWNDVNEDWPFYSEEEKRMLKRRKPQNLTPPLSSDSANSLSPRASPHATKRSSTSVANAAGSDELPAKKQRISHYRRPSPPSSGYATTSSGERHASDNEDERTNVKKDNGYTLNFTTVKDLCASPVKTNGFRNSPPVERHSPPVERNSPPVARNSPPVARNSPPVVRNSPPIQRNSPPVERNSLAVETPHSPPVEQTSITEKDITISEPLDNTELASVQLMADPNAGMTDDIERQYPPITSSSTRRAYKNEFATLYTEYQQLYQDVAAVAALFTRLEEQLNRAPPHSPQHQNIGQRIVEEYRRIRGDTTHQQKSRRLNYLHRKLTHIKRMVHQYDHLRNLKPERVSAASTTQAY